MLPYVHEGQGKERCLLRARNTVFWPKMTYDVQQLIEKCIICQEHGKSQPIIGTTQELPPFPWHTLATDMFYWKRMDFIIVADVFSKYIIVRKLPNSTSAAVCTDDGSVSQSYCLCAFLRVVSFTEANEASFWCFNVSVTAVVGMYSLYYFVSFGTDAL